VFPSVWSTLWAPTGLQSRRPGRLSQAGGQGRPSFGKDYRQRSDCGAYSPLQIGSSRTVPAVLTRHLQSSPVICSLCQLPVGPANYMQGQPVTSRARPSSGITRLLSSSETPAVPHRPPRAVIRTDDRIPARQVRTRRRTNWTLGNTAIEPEQSLLSLSVSNNPDSQLFHEANDILP